MGLSLTLRVFKGCGVEAFRAALESAFSRSGGRFAWGISDHSAGIECRTAHLEDVHTLYMPYAGGTEFTILQRAANELNVPWMELHIQEGSLWDFALSLGSKTLDKFSVNPAYWDDDPAQLKEWAGHPDVVAQSWAVPAERIRNYMVNWQPKETEDGVFEYAKKGKAYASDGHGYGDVWQIFDFLRAIGARNPVNGGPDMLEHRVIMPSKLIY